MQLALKMLKLEQDKSFQLEVQKYRTEMMMSKPQPINAVPSHAALAAAPASKVIQNREDEIPSAFSSSAID